MQTMAKVAFEPTKEKARAKLAVVRRGEHNPGASGDRSELIGATLSDAIALDAQPLLEDFEAEKPRRFYSSDAFDEISTIVNAANGTPHAPLVTFGTQWLRQQKTQHRPGSSWDVLVEHETLPDGFWRARKL